MSSAGAGPLRSATWRVLLVGAVVGALTPVRVFPDSLGYLDSARSFFSGSFGQDYFWLREPLYAVFLRVLLELPPAVTLVALPVTQGVALAGALRLLATAMGRLGLLRHTEAGVYYALTCLLLTGYVGTALQQTLVVLAAAALLHLAVRLVWSPPSRGLLAATAVTCAGCVLLSGIFLPAAAMLPLAALVVHGRRPHLVAVVTAWGSAAAAALTWALVRAANGQGFGLGGASVLDRANTTDWPLRLQAFLATFGLSPDFFDGTFFNVLSYSNVALGLNGYVAQATCADTTLSALTEMPDAFLVCGSTLGPSIPPALYPAATAYVLTQVLVGAVALVWAWAVVEQRLLFVYLLLMTAGPCLPVAVFLADGNSRYGLPVLALSLVLTVAMVTRGRRQPDGRDVQADGLRPTQSTL